MKKLARRALWTIAIAGSLGAVVWAQTPGPSADAFGPPPQNGETFGPDQDFSAPGPHGGAFGGMGGGGMGMGGFGYRRGALPHPVSQAAAQESHAIHQAMGKLKSAKTDAEKTAATNEISKLLEKSFQRDLDEREKHVAEVEARVKKLREQIEKRKKAKDDIVSLRLKTIVNESEGLGFPDDGPGPRGFLTAPGFDARREALPEPVRPLPAMAPPEVPAQIERPKDPPGTPGSEPQS
jgi:hypothetical protein